MPDIVSGVPGFIWSLAGVAFTALCGGAWRWLKGFKGEHAELVEHLEEADGMRAELAEVKALNETQNRALREILGNMLDREHERLARQGYASATEKAKFERMYRPYHACGGNGTRTAHYEDVMSMHALPDDAGE